MTQVFISYRRDDAPGYTGRIYEGLVRVLGRNAVYRDINRLEAGVDFADDLDRALRESDVVLVVMGRHWLGKGPGARGARRIDDPKDFVRQELATALKLRVPVLPALVDRAAMPPRSELPRGLARLASQQAYELSERTWEDDMNTLLERVQALASSHRRKQAPDVEVVRRNYFQRIVRLRFPHESHTIKLANAGVFGWWIDVDGVTVQRSYGGSPRGRFGVELSDGANKHDCVLAVTTGMFAMQMALAVDGSWVYNEQASRDAADG